MVDAAIASSARQRLSAIFNCADSSLVAIRDSFQPLDTVQCDFRNSLELLDLSAREFEAHRKGFVPLGKPVDSFVDCHEIPFLFSVYPQRQSPKKIVNLETNSAFVA
jgi:hypothetical protein